ncbi:MlaC/ttg2D family ABC transporter substrate-binding protein [Rubrivivax gelatinosus]|uniref:Toluene tolerance family protein n=1 Tax=Rubrivivax gelatinosus (strain NBRC 100245 / IL144) TaxID=983917 RepID=I0HMD8_RUBGI|nr:ABC transporter substrate-binding protein [Rubrivivax gelatinosus]MBG6080781.1 phospholipid transport system substrate-binding protein [Rubrivivax gelatinosus]BAL94175.1 toluene tolerance family protein [Rubrivivax gelatinosus IL144]
MFKKFLSGLALLGFLVAGAHAEPGAPDAFVRTISNDVINTAKTDKAIQSGDINAVVALVDKKVMPAVAFEVVTRSAVGPQWRSATPDQRAKLQAEFKTLLVKVYAGALTQLKDQTVEITKTQPVPGGTQVVVQSEVRGKGEPIKLDYRLDQQQGAWKIIDVNVGGIWLVQSYRSQFAQEISAGGIDGLIAKLVERNKAPAQPAKKG